MILDIVFIRMFLLSGMLTLEIFQNNYFEACITFKTIFLYMF